MNSPGALWYKKRIVLFSPLAPDELRRRLKEALPRFDVRTGQNMPVASFRAIFKEISYGRLRKDGTFWLSSPSTGDQGSLVAIEGTIEAHEQGSLICLVATNACGLLLGVIALASGIVFAIAFQSFLVALVAPAAFAVLLSPLWLLQSSVAGASVARRLECLEKLFHAQPGHT